MHAFNIGMFLGCSYYTFKYGEFSEGSRLDRWLTQLRDNNLRSVLCFFIGLILNFTVLGINKLN